MFLGLDARIGQVIDFDLQSHLFARCFNHMRDIQNRKTLGKLVKHAALAGLRRVQTRELNTADSIANVKKTACLSSTTVDGERRSDRRLNAEAVQNRYKYLIVIKAIDQGLVERHFVRDGSIHDALVEIGSAQSPCAAGEHNVVTVVYLRKVIERTGLPGIRKDVFSPFVFDPDGTLFDVKVGCAGLSHGPELDQMTLWPELSQGEQQVERPDDIVHLSKDSVFAVDHRVGRRTLLCKMNHGVRFHFLDG